VNIDAEQVDICKSVMHFSSFHYATGR